jgi:hypothetical protein
VRVLEIIALPVTCEPVHILFRGSHGKKRENLGEEKMGIGVVSATIRVLCLGVALEGCAVPYLHDDAAQKATDTAQASWKAADPSTVFDSQKAQFASLSIDEQASVKASITARRDLQLIILLRGDQAAAKTLRDRLDELTGGLDSTRLQALDRTISQDRTSLDLDNLRLQDTRKQFRTAGFADDVSDCGKLGPAPAVPNLTDLHAGLLDQIKVACADVAKSELHIEQEIDAGYLTTGDKQRAGELGQTVTALQTFREDLKDQTERGDALKKKLASLKKQVDDDKDPATAEFAKSALKFCAADPSTGTTASADVTSATLQSALKECLADATVGADPLVKGVKHTFLVGEIQSAISAILSTEASKAAAQPSPADAKVASSTTTALKTLDLLTQAADEIAANGQPSVNALLVGLAYEQHQVTMNELAVQTLQQRIALLTEKREAEVGEIAHLARAVAHSNAPASGAVLTEVNAAWNAGRYRAELADYADIDLIRRNSLRHASEVATSWKNLLQPAVDELAAYGKGGLDQQTIASLIIAAVNAGGLSAIAAK